MEYDLSEFIGPASADSEKPIAKPAYRHQDFPRVMYGPEGAQKRVKSQEDADALGPAWSSKPPLPEKDEDAAGPARPAEVRKRKR